MRVTDYDRNGKRKESWIEHDEVEVTECEESEFQYEFDDKDVIDDGESDEEGETTHQKVVKLIELASENLMEQSKRLTVSDLLRLVQLEKSLRPADCNRLVVEWLDRIPEVG